MNSVSPECSVVVLRTREEIETIRSAWTSWNGHRDSDLDFFLLLARVQPNVLGLYVLLVSRNGSPDAILVGRIENRSLSFRIGYVTVPGPTVKLLKVQYGGLRGNQSTENCKLLITHILGALKAGDADVADLNFIETESPLTKMAREMPGFLTRDRFPSLRAHWSTALPADARNLFADLSGDQRWQLRRKAKKFEEKFGGTGVVHQLRNPSEVEIICRDTERVARLTYQRAIGVGFDDGPESCARLKFLAESEWLRAYLLYIAGQPVAFWIGSVYKRVFVSEFLAFDPSYAKDSPGIYVMTRALDALCREGVERVDFGVGDAEYKRRLGGLFCQEIDTWIFSLSMRGLIAATVKTISSGADLLLKTSLQRIGVLRPIKRLYRRLVPRALEAVTTR